MNTTSSDSCAEQAVRRAWEVIDATLNDVSPVDLGWVQPPLTDNDWRLAPDAVRFLSRLVRALRPKHVLEYGSGLSTRILAKECSALAIGTRITSFDHDPDFIVKREDIDYGNLVVELAPIVARNFGGKHLACYWNINHHLASVPPVDLVLIDGPPECVGGREAALYQALEHAHPGTIALLDDAQRRVEQKAVSNWIDSLGGLIEVRTLPGFSKGMVAVVAGGPVRVDSLWQLREDLTRIELAELLPKGSIAVLADGGCFGAALIEHCQVTDLHGGAGDWQSPPANSEEAMAQFDRMIEHGARYFVLAWPVFWWMECYEDFVKALRSKHECLAENDRLIVFKITDSAPCPGEGPM